MSNIGFLLFLLLVKLKPETLSHEISENNQVNVLFSGEWYAVDGDFMEDLNRSLDRINISSLDFPKVNEYIEGSELKIETEG
ncbi:hypothetical protein F9879_20430, partial [Morganella morganii]